MKKKPETPKATGFDTVLRRMLATPPQTLADSVKPATKQRARVDRPKAKA
jgi:hypothetical protein